MLIDVDKEIFNKNKLTVSLFEKILQRKTDSHKKIRGTKGGIYSITLSPLHLYYVLHYLMFYDKYTLSSASPHSPCAHAIHH